MESDNSGFGLGLGILPIVTFHAIFRVSCNFEQVVSGGR